MVKGAIAAGHTKTAEAGRLMLEAGGNAFDAAVAATLAACVVEPMLTSIGGGGFLLAHPAQGKDSLFDFFTQTPRQNLPRKELDFYPVRVNFGDATQDFHVGLGSIAVPGTLAGVLEVHQQLGRLPRSVVFAPAIALAQTGVRINPFQAYCIKILAPILTLTAEGRAIYQVKGHPLQIGDLLHLPNLAPVLEHFAEAGADSLYRGELAQQIIRDCRERGGSMTAADLEQYVVMSRSPLRFNYRNHTLLTNPPPSSGGTLIAFALALLNGIHLSDHFGRPQQIQALVQTMRLTNQARKDGYDERLYDPEIAHTFLNAKHLAPYLNDLIQSLPEDNGPGCKLGSTTHISVIDDEGNAASVTTSNGEGSGYFIPGTGIMLNNMLGEEDLNPQGFHQWLPNQRLSSMMAPTLVLKNSQPELAIGSGGSNRIRTAILQVLCNVLDFHLPLKEAIQFPRIHWELGTLNWEPGWDETTIQTVLSRALPEEEQSTAWSDQNMFFGGVHAVQKGEDGSFTGAGDPRRCGAFEQSRE